MNNMLKTVFVVSVMGGALYGAYVLLNENEFRSRQAAAEAETVDGLDISIGDATGAWPAGRDSGPTSFDSIEPGPYEFPEEAAGSPATVPPAPTAFPPATAETLSAPGGMAETTAEDVVRSLGGSQPFGGGSLPPDVAPVAEAPEGSTPVDDSDFQTADAGPISPGEPSDLAVPPEMESTPGAGSGQFGSTDGGFQPLDEGAVTPVPGEFEGPGFDDGTGTPLASASATEPPFEGSPDPAVATTSEVAAEAARQSYFRTIEAAKACVAEQNYRDALAALSIAYGNPDLPSPEREELNDLLDALAAKVIYSSEHLHQPPYVVQPGDTFESIASRYAITPEFLAKINGIEMLGVPPETGTSLKVVRGPFRAEVRLRSNLGGSLTLYLGELYAGRFDIELGQDNPPFPGKYTVKDKGIARQFMRTDGSMIPGDSPENPYGGYWIDLGSGISLHGSPATPTPGGRLGCMAVAGEGQAGDLFVILSHASTVEVRR